MDIHACYLPRRFDPARAALLALCAQPLALALLLLFFVLLPLGLYFLPPLLDPYGGVVRGSAWLLLIPPLMLACLVLTPLRLSRRANALHGEHRWTLDDSGVRFEGPGFDQRLEWSMFSRALVVRAGLVLVQRDQVVALLPRRAFLPGTEPHIRAILRERGLLGAPRKWMLIGPFHRTAH